MKKNNFKVASSPAFRLKRIRFLPTLKDVIGFVKSFYDAGVIDVAVMYGKYTS